MCWGNGEPVKVEEVQVEPPKSSEVRVKILYASVCHTDLIFIKGFPIVSIHFLPNCYYLHLLSTRFLLAKGYDIICWSTASFPSGSRTRRCWVSSQLTNNNTLTEDTNVLYTSILKINIHFTIYIYIYINKFRKCAGFLTRKKIYLLFDANTIIMEITQREIEEAQHLLSLRRFKSLVD